MSTLNSTSTLAQIKAAYADNASYAEDASIAKAKKFVTACRLLLLRLPKRATQDSSEYEMDVKIIQQEMQAAQAYAQYADSGSTVTHPDFTNYRN